jgi:flagellar basal body rod protein FlgG
VEGSNVDPIRVMTEMIDVLRGYESYQKAMLSMNDIVSKTVNEVGKIS